MTQERHLPTALLAAGLLALASTSPAAPQLNPLFSDGMVLQRDLRLPIWGTSEPGDKITVEFSGQQAEATADPDGRWEAQLSPLPANAEPQTLVVRGRETITVNDVVVGDVFLAGGQSNMDSPLRSGLAAEALPSAQDPLLRFFTVTKAVAAQPQDQVKGRWLPTTPENAKDFSAVAYFFARDVREKEKVPVGIIRSAWGGTPIKTWMSLASLRQDPPMSAPLKEWEDAYAKYEATRSQPELMEAYYKDMKDWETNVEPAFKAAKKAHAEAVAAAKAAGQTPPPAPVLERPEPTMPNPIAMPAASKRPSVPTISYNAMISPLAPYGLRGILWYQGEADGSRGAEYRQLFPRLIQDWRQSFRQAELPFLFVQLPASGTDPDIVTDKGMSILRSAQASALQLPATGMAVTLDIGDPKDAHPDNKVHVGHRLAIAGRKVVYGEDLVYFGPTYVSHEIRDGKAYVTYKHTGGGLIIGQAPWRAKSMPEVPTDRLVGFALAGVDGKWHAADAVIDGDTVVVSSPSVPTPTSVAYGWADSPSVNLYNKENLPAAPFRVDQ
jgi:sialate O-acetylesterase